MNPTITKAAVGFLLLAQSLVMTGCVSVPLDLARQEFDRGQYQEAIDILSSDKIRSKDRLLALMEKGLIQHQAGEFENSSQTFLQASSLLNSSDFISISEQGAALIINDNATTYRGEFAERLWIHTYQMMNFLLLNQAEGAAVEARQALKLFGEHNQTLDRDWFTRALTGVAFDSAGLPNDAYIEYRKLADSMPSPEPLALVLHQRAKQLGFTDDALHFASLAGDFGATGKTADAELIVFVAEGRIPKKRSGHLYIYPDVSIAFPYYEPGREVFHSLDIDDNGAPLSHTAISSDLSELARSSLSARGKAIAARQTARAVTKHALVDLAGSESETGAAVLQALLFILEMADTRGWETLPAHLSIVRIPLKAGQHDIVLTADPRNRGGVSAVSRANLSVTIKPGQRQFRKVRF